MIRLALRPPASGGIKEPFLLPGPDPGSKDFLRGSGVFSLTTSILGASGVLICGRLGLGCSEMTLCWAGFSLPSTAKLGLSCDNFY